MTEPSSEPFIPPGKTRAEALREKPPELVADVYLYPTSEGGKRRSVELGWGCPCSVEKSTDIPAWDGWPLLDSPLAPGDRRRVGFVFLCGDEAATVLAKAGKFYLWEGHFIGEATVITDDQGE